MSIKLLLVFVEYNESNTLLLLQAIDKVDSMQGATFLLTCIELYFSLPTSDFGERWRPKYADNRKHTCRCALAICWYVGMCRICYHATVNMF